MSKIPHTHLFPFMSCLHIHICTFINNAMQHPSKMEKEKTTVAVKLQKKNFKGQESKCLSLKNTLKVLLFSAPRAAANCQAQNCTRENSATSRRPYQAHFKHTHTHTLKPLQTSTQHLCFDYKLQPHV